MTQTDLAALLASAPRNCWLALNEDETAVVGRGETLEEAVHEARKNKVEDPDRSLGSTNLGCKPLN